MARHNPLKPQKTHIFIETVEALCPLNFVQIRHDFLPLASTVLTKFAGGCARRQLSDSLLVRKQGRPTIRVIETHCAAMRMNTINLLFSID